MKIKEGTTGLISYKADKYGKFIHRPFLWDNKWQTNGIDQMHHRPLSLQERKRRTSLSKLAAAMDMAKSTLSAMLQRIESRIMNDMAEEIRRKSP